MKKGLMVKKQTKTKPTALMVYSAACGMKVSAGNDDTCFVCNMHSYLWRVIFCELFSFVPVPWFYVWAASYHHTKVLAASLRCNRWDFTVILHPSSPCVQRKKLGAKHFLTISQNTPLTHKTLFRICKIYQLLSLLIKQLSRTSL